jgi:protein-disulfide isomerase
MGGATLDGATRSPAGAPLDIPALKVFLADLFSYGAGEISVEQDVAFKVPGYRLVRATKNFVGPPSAIETQSAFLDDAGTQVLAGMLFVDEERPAQPVKADADLATTRQLLRGKVFGSVGQSVALDPSHDIPSWKALSVTIETGYGHYSLPAYLSADDGRLLLIGRPWERGRSLVEQRRLLIDLSATPFDGAKDATVNVVEYSDMQCPSCRKKTAEWTALVDRLKGSPAIRRYVKSYPLVQAHPWAFRAASAGRCLFQHEPGLFFRWKGNVFNRQDDLSVAALDAFAMDFAEANGVGSEEFAACYLRPASTDRILADLAEGFIVGVRSTPTYVVDGVLVSWFTDDLMEEFLRKTYLKGAGLPLARKAAPIAPKASRAASPTSH